MLFLICVHELCKLLYFVSDYVYVKLQYVYVVCSGVCSIIGRGVQRVVWRRWRWWLGWSRGLMSPC